jgi:hypothetical protein
MEKKFNLFWEVTKYWLPLVALTTVFCALVYVVAQNNLRSNANDPQIQMAEDAAFAFANGITPQLLDKVDMAKSIAPYLIVFDDSGKVLSSSATLDGQTPLPPSGVFPDGKSKGELRFTWQPQTGVRSAAVLVHYSGKDSGFVLAGRSLREVEKREDSLAQLVALGWLAATVVTLPLVLFFSWFPRRK